MRRFSIALAGITLVFLQWPFKAISDLLDRPIDRLIEQAERLRREGR